MSLADITSADMLVFALMCIAGLFVVRFIKGTIKLVVLACIVFAVLCYLGYV